MRLTVWLTLVRTVVGVIGVRSLVDVERRIYSVRQVLVPAPLSDGPTSQLLVQITVFRCVGAGARVAWNRVFLISPAKVTRAVGYSLREIRWARTVEVCFGLMLVVPSLYRRQIFVACAGKSPGPVEEPGRFLPALRTRQPVQMIRVSKFDLLPLLVSIGLLASLHGSALDL